MRTLYFFHQLGNPLQIQVNPVEPNKRWGVRIPIFFQASDCVSAVGFFVMGVMQPGTPGFFDLGDGVPGVQGGRFEPSLL